MEAHAKAQELEGHFGADLMFSRGYESEPEFPQSFAIGDPPNECDGARDSLTRGWWADLTPEDERAADEWLKRWRAWDARRRCVEILRRYGRWACRGRPTLDPGPEPQPPLIHNTARRKADQLLGPNGVENLSQQFIDALQTNLACGQHKCLGGAPCSFSSKVIHGWGIDWIAKKVYFDVQVYAQCTCGQGIEP